MTSTGGRNGGRFNGSLKGAGVKILAGLNALLLAVSLVVLSSARDVVGQVRDNEISIAVIQSNRFTDQNGRDMEHRIEDDLALELQTLRLELIARLDRIETRIDRIGRGGGGTDE